MQTILGLVAVLALAGCDKMWNEQTLTVDGSNPGTYSQSQTGMGNKQSMKIGSRDSGDDSAGMVVQEQRGTANRQSLEVKGSGTVIQKQSGINREQSMSVDGKKGSVHVQIDK